MSRGLVQAVLSIVGVACGLWVVPHPALTQEVATEARLVAFTIEPVDPELGEVFQLGVTVRVAPDFVIFVPDTLIPGVASASAGPGEWTEREAPGDSVEVQATYPVMGFVNGLVDLPSLELAIRAPAQGEVVGPRPMSELEAGRLDPAARRISIPVGSTQIIPLSSMSGAAGQLTPRPPADVLGGSWSPWLMAALGIGVIVVGAALWLLVTTWMERGGPPGLPHSVRSPRLEALRELDRIKASGWLEEGRVLEFYESSTGVLRRFSEQSDPDWGIALTSTELMSQLDRRWGSDAVDELGSAVAVAEWVKFGSHRPDAPTAEGHWTTIRSWIEEQDDT